MLFELLKNLAEWILNVERFQNDPKSQIRPDTQYRAIRFEGTENATNWFKDRENIMKRAIIETADFFG